MKTQLEKWRKQARQARMKQWELERGEPLPGLPTKARPPARRRDALVLGSGRIKTLTEAIKVVPAGGRIVVPAGLYRQTKAIETSKPFTLVGAGASQSGLVLALADDALCLSGEGTWSFHGLSMWIEPSKKHRGSDLLHAHSLAKVEAHKCLFGGAVAVVKENGNLEGGCSVRAFDGGQISLFDCHLAASNWGGAAHGKGARLELKGGAVYYCDLGLFAGSSGGVVARETTLLTCRHAVKTFGKSASIELADCRLVDSFATAAYAESGTVQLDRCCVDEPGGHGIACERAGQLIVRDCCISDSWRSGAVVGGRATLERNEFRNSTKHGIEIQAGSSGTVTANRCIHNEAFGILHSPKSRVKLAGNNTRAFDAPKKKPRIRKGELSDGLVDDVLVSIEVAPLKKLPKGLPTLWRKALVADDPCEDLLRNLWQPWQSALPQTFRVYEAHLRFVALLQTQHVAASLLYVFEHEGQRYFSRGYPPVEGRPRQARRLPKNFVDLFAVHDGLTALHGDEFLRTVDWHDLTLDYDEDEIAEVAPGVALEDFLVVHRSDSRYLGFDLSKRKPRCLAWHPREDAEPISNVVEHLDTVLSEQFSFLDQ